MSSRGPAGAGAHADCELFTVAAIGGRRQACHSRQIAIESEGRIKLVSFKETNGPQDGLGSIPFYFMEYQAEIEFTEDCRWYSQATDEGRGAFGRAKPW